MRGGEKVEKRRKETNDESGYVQASKTRFALRRTNHFNHYFSTYPEVLKCVVLLAIPFLVPWWYACDSTPTGQTNDPKTGD